LRLSARGSVLAPGRPHGGIVRHVPLAAPGFPGRGTARTPLSFQTNHGTDAG